MKVDNKDTEQRILEAAVREFSTKGFDGARTTAIAADAGVTHAMLHYYFRSKEKLFERIYTDKIHFIMNLVFGALGESGKDLLTRLRNGIICHFDFLLANAELPAFIINTMNSRPELFDGVKAKMAAEARQRLDALQAEFDAAAADGIVARIDVSMLLADIVSLNIFPFLAIRLMMPVLGYGADDYEAFMEKKKMENVETILRRLSPVKL